MDLFRHSNGNENTYLFIFIQYKVLKKWLEIKFKIIVYLFLKKKYTMNLYFPFL
jgi:hypothetical protein